MSASAVKSKLDEGFTKDDVYRVCESFSNSVINGVSYENISESVVSNARVNNTSTPTSSRIEEMMLNAGNRRGLGINK